MPVTPALDMTTQGSLSTMALLAWLVASGLAHFVAFGSLRWLPPPPPVLASTSATVEIVQEQPRRPEPDADPEDSAPEPPPPPVQAKVARRPLHTRARPVPPPADTPPAPPKEPPPEAPPAQETPVDFTGVTLTQDSDDAAWASAVGSGEPLRGPAGSPGSVTGRTKDGLKGGVVGGKGAEAVVPVQQLARRPEPPDLDGALRHLYPRRAKAQAIEGQATVRMQVGASGRPSHIVKMAESPAGSGFFESCRQALEQARWKPGVDHQGRAVATSGITFECRFEIQY